MTRSMVLRLELRDVTPLVWRILRVPTDMRLDDLHHAIQAVMGWDDFHPHVFEVGDEEYGPRVGPEDEDEDGFHERSAWAGEDHELTVADALSKNAELIYIYNFAEEWRVRVTRDTAQQPGAPSTGDSLNAAELVVCIAGANSGPQQESPRAVVFSLDAVNRRLSSATRPRATPQFPAGRGASSDQQLLANLTLVVLMLGSRPTRDGRREAWKNLRTEILESLEEAGLVDTAPQRKSVTLTDTGIAHAQGLVTRLKTL